jgi:phosphatidylglycerol lysyltransferase
MLRWLGPLLVVVVAGLAGWALWRQLAGLDWAEVAHLLTTLHPGQVIAAGVLLMVSLCAYTGLELVAARQMVAPLGLRRAGLAALAAQGISLSTGKGILVAGLVRIRLFKAWGQSPTQAMGSTLLVFIHGNVGLTALLVVIVGLWGPWWWHLWLAAAGATALTAWLALGWWWEYRGGPSWHWRGVHLRPPTPGQQGAGLALGFVEKLACTLLAWILIPGALDISGVTFIAVFGVAILVARASQVPGGLGVLEASVLGLWPIEDPAQRPALVAGILAFRLAYYLVPLLPGLLVLALAPRLGRVPPCATASA